MLEGGKRAQKWLSGQVLLMLILGSSSALVFGLLHVNYFYALAVFAGLANFVPVLGPIATVILAGFVAALDSWMKVLGVLIFYLVYQQVENAYLTPRIMEAKVDLPAVAVVVALAIGGALAGVLGALVAVPSAAILATVVDRYLVKKDDDQKQMRVA
jgi:predicted PurR-regulated permease PerM